MRLRSLGPAVAGFPVNSAELVGDRAYVASMDLSPARLLEYDVVARRVLRTVPIPAGTRFWAITSAGSELYLGLWKTDGQPNLYSFDPLTQTFTARATIPSAVEFWTLDAAPDDTVYAGTDVTGQVFAYHPATGQLTSLTFEDVPGSQISALAATDQTIYVGTRRQGGRILAIDRSTSAVLELAAQAGDGVYSLKSSEEFIVAGTEGPARVVVIGRGDGVRLNAEIPGEAAVDALEIAGGAVYFTGKPSGTLYALDLATGTVSVVGRPVPQSPTRALFVAAGRLLGVSAADTVWDHEPPPRGSSG